MLRFSGDTPEPPALRTRHLPTRQVFWCFATRGTPPNPLTLRSQHLPTRQVWAAPLLGGHPRTPCAPHQTPADTSGVLVLRFSGDTPEPPLNPPAPYRSQGRAVCGCSREFFIFAPSVECAKAVFGYSRDYLSATALPDTLV